MTLVCWCAKTGSHNITCKEQLVFGIYWQRNHWQGLDSHPCLSERVQENRAGLDAQSHWIVRVFLDLQHISFFLHWLPEFRIKTDIKAPGMNVTIEKDFKIISPLLPWNSIRKASFHFSLRWSYQYHTQLLLSMVMLAHYIIPGFTSETEANYFFFP